MKWLIGFLLCLNLFVFVLAWFSKDEIPGYAAPIDLPDDVQSIDLLSAYTLSGSGNCTNLGPIEQEIVLDQFVKILNQQQTSFKVISEPGRMIAVYRVVIPVVNENEIADLKDQLNTVGIDEVYKKTSASGDAYLSLGVFTYEKTAQDFASNLSATGFAANYQNESLEYPPRYWLNLKKALDKKIIKTLNEYIGSSKLQQTSATCL